MQKTLLIKLSIIAGLCVLFAVGLNMIGSVIYERQNYAESVVKEITQQHVDPQEIITPFIAIPTTVTPECQTQVPDLISDCAASYPSVETLFASQTQSAQNLKVSTDTYKRGVYHATSYNGEVKFDQNYSLDNQLLNSSNQNLSETSTVAIANQDNIVPEQTLTHWNKAKLIIPVSDLRGLATLPTVTIGKRELKATYPQATMIKGLTYVEVALTQELLTQLNGIVVHVPLSGISNINTVPTGQNFELTMQSNWHAPNFIGTALPNIKNFTQKGFDAKWQNQYLTMANNQRLSQCLSIPHKGCAVVSSAYLDTNRYASEVSNSIDAAAESGVPNSIRLSSFGVSFAEPNDVYLQTQRTMKYALLLILVSFGTFFLFEVIKSSRIHPIQYLLVGCALFVFYVLLLPLAEQIVFWKAYAIAASACVGLIGWYTYYVLGGVKRAVIFTATLAGLYASFFGILTTEDMNLLLGAVFCFVILACVMVMTRKVDWYKVA
ncbi:MAG: cell envelope integrity protein CreD [Psychrobacter sp.]|uniref:cell envelope integrity protein CreD n=1 Tax=unclassified Psychrobacter TaxID=196806 RepID=UPI0017886C6D|nr:MULTISPECIES: cell envelope integrity protein CreD [unclassified Psychrobacter]MBE0442951.1 cell envelope integrity protein CreD [Psychrobacter sp. FME13]